MEIGLAKSVLSFFGLITLNFFAAGSGNGFGGNKRNEKIQLNSLENARRFVAGTWTGSQDINGGTNWHKYIFNIDGTFDRYFAPAGAQDWEKVLTGGKWEIGTETNLNTGEEYYFAVLNWKADCDSNAVIKAVLDNEFEENLFMVDTFWRFTFIAGKKDISPFPKHLGK